MNGQTTTDGHIEDTIESLFRSSPIPMGEVEPKGPADAESGTEVVDQATDEPGDDNENLEQPEGGTTEVVSKTQEQTTAPESKEEIELLKQLVAQTAPKTEAGETPDPFKVTFDNKWAPELVNALNSDDQETRLRAYNEMLRLTQQDTADKVIGKIKEILPSIIQVATEKATNTTATTAATTRNREAFVSENPDLADPDVMAFAQSVAGRMFKGMSPAELTASHRKQLADEVRAKLKLTPPKKTAPPEMLEQKGGSRSNTKPKVETPTEKTLSEVFPNMAARRAKSKGKGK